MRIFMTGATGVIGRRVVPQLIASGHAVTGVARSREGFDALERMGASGAALDLFDAAAARTALAGHEAVVNLATHVPKSAWRAFLPSAWKETARLRSVASSVLVDAALANGVERFVQESFAPIYPDRGAEWISEEVSPEPARYNRATLDAEASAGRFTRAGGTGVALRFAYFYGPGDPFVQGVAEAVRHGWWPILGRPDGFLSMVHHDDAASAVIAALELPSGIYNVVEDEPLTRRDFADEVSVMLGVEPPRIPGAWLARLTGPVGATLARSLRISNRKLRSASSWAPRYANARSGWKAALGPQRPSAHGAVASG
jgi:2-alkyl-3-oxoalkanoate reductase